MAGAGAGRRAILSSRDLYYATYHQAAHAVVAAMLGGTVDHLQIGYQPETIGWNPDSASSGDFETLCAAGFAMELILGRRHDAAWESCRDDRTTLRRIVVERAGIPLDQTELAKRFSEGADHARSVLSHPGVRTMVDTIAEALGDAYLAKEEGLSGVDVRQMIGPLIDLEAPRIQI